MKDSMRFLPQPASICFAAACLFSGLAYAQGPPRGFWTAPDANAAHTNAQKAETEISPDTVTKDFKFLWKLKLGSGPTKSIVITCQGLSGIGRGRSIPAGFCIDDFTAAHVVQPPT